MLISQQAKYKIVKFIIRLEEIFSSMENLHLKDISQAEEDKKSMEHNVHASAWQIYAHL